MGTCVNFGYSLWRQEQKKSVGKPWEEVARTQRGPVAFRFECERDQSQVADHPGLKGDTSGSLPYDRTTKRRRRPTGSPNYTQLHPALGQGTPMFIRISVGPCV